MINEEMQQIINSIQPNWSRDCIIRYLYIKLAPFFQRDLCYFLASDEEKYEEFKKGFINRGRHIVCSTLVDFYVSLFTSLGIPAKKIRANSAKIPLFAMIVEGDLGWYFLDPLNDLFANQYGLQTTEFGKIPRYKTLKENYPFLIFLPDEYLESLDKQIGLDKKYNDFFNLLHLEMTNKYLLTKYFDVDVNNKLALFQKRMEFANTHLINLGSVNGPFERVRLYLFLERIMFFKSEKPNLRIYLDQTKETPLMHIEYTNFYDGSSMLFEEEKKDNQFILQKIK